MILFCIGLVLTIFVVFNCLLYVPRPVRELCARVFVYCVCMCVCVSYQLCTKIKFSLPSYYHSNVYTLILVFSPFFFPFPFPAPAERLSEERKLYEQAMTSHAVSIDDSVTVCIVSSFRIFCKIYISVSACSSLSRVFQIVWLHPKYVKP